jgi:hypothetical protein
MVYICCIRVGNVSLPNLKLKNIKVMKKVENGVVNQTNQIENRLPIGILSSEFMVEDYSLVFNLNTAQTIFRIVREYDKMLKWNTYNKGLEQ